MTTPKLVMLGGFRLYDATGATLPLTARKAQALLGYVSMQPEQRCSRDRLAALLWEDSSASRARQSLRQVLAELRKALPDEREVLEVTDEEIRVSPGAMNVDVHELEEYLDAATPEGLRKAIELYQGEFLEGFNPRAPAFEDWLMAERSRLRQRAIAGLEQLLRDELAAGGIADAIRHALQLLSLDPLLESAHRTLMELYARQGHFGAALKQYRICQHKLRRELDVAPEPKTDHLFRRIMRDRQAAAGDDAEARTIRPAPVSDEVANGAADGTALSPEPRQATVLLVRVNVMDDDPETQHAVVQHLGAEIEARIRRYGGQPIQDAGSNVLAAFGIPTAHGNDAERAIRAAASIRQTHPQARIGMASGRVMVSNDTFSMVTGDAVDQAADLAGQGASGEIRMSGPLYTSVARVVEAERLAQGRDEAWRLLDLCERAPAGQAPFVGRERERRQCRVALETCQEMACGQSLLVRGEAGIGKSRLLDECAILAEQMGFATHKVLGHDFGAGGDPVQALVRSLLGQASDDDAERNRSAAEGAVDKGLVDASRQAELFDVLALPLPGRLKAVYEAMDDATRRDRRQRVVTDLVSACARRRPLLLMVEDIHWAERATLTDLARLAATVADCPAVLVMSHRLEGAPLEPAWRGAMDGAPLTTIDLGPLRGDEVRTLAAELAADSDFVHRCIQRSGGNPWFLEQLLQTEAPDTSAIPDSVRSLVWARLDRLEPLNKRAAQAAAVLGPSVSVPALAYLVEDPDFDVTPLVDQRLLYPESRDYRFSHDLIREGIYESLAASQQRAFHDRAAEWYRGDNATLRAQHLDWAGSPEAPAAYLEAARAQSRTYRVERARSLVNRGLELAANAPDVYALRCLQAEILHETGDIDAAINAYRQAAAVATDDEQQCHAWLGVAAGYGVKDRHQDALTALEQAEGLAGHRAAPLARLETLRGNVLFPLGRITQCLKAHQRGRKYAREAESPELEARALSGLGDAAYLFGRMITAHGHFDRCVALARSHGLARIEASNLPMRGLTLFYQNDLAGARRDGIEALELAGRIAHARAETLCRAAVLTVLCYQADWETAEEEAEEGLALARRLGTQRFEADFLLDLGLIRLCQGRGPEAEQYLDRAYAVSRQAVQAYVGPWILGAMAAATADSEKRKWALETGEALLAGGSAGHNYLHFYQHAIDVALAEADRAAAQRYCQALEEHTRREPLPWSELFIARGRALAAWQSGEHDPAVQRELQRLADEAEKAGLRVALPGLQAALAAA